MTTLYHYMADVLSGCYAITHNYALAIALLTLIAVGLTTPLTWKSTRGMLAMQMLAPEIKKLQAKYKGDKEALNREMMALYKENNINPLAGCLPLLPQMVVFFVLYRTIYNLSHKAQFPTRTLAQAACGSAGGPVPVPKSSQWTCATFVPSNVSRGSHLYQNLVASGGHMRVFGFDLTLGVRTAHGSAVIGCWILVVLVVAAYWFQTKQMSSRNPAAAAANPQMQTMQKIFPFFFGFISITIQAGVNVYFLVSALCRIGQQSLMYRHDPVLRRHVANARAAAPINAKSTEKKGFFASLQEAFGPSANQPPPRKPGGSGGSGGSGGTKGPGRNGGSLPPAKNPTRDAESSTAAPVPPPPPASRPSSSDIGRPASRPAADPGPQSRWARIWAAASGADATGARSSATVTEAKDLDGEDEAVEEAGNGSGNGSAAGNGSSSTGVTNSPSAGARPAPAAKRPPPAHNRNRSRRKRPRR